MDINNPVPLTNIRCGTFSIGQQEFPASCGLIRMALLFQIEQLSLTMSSMIADGEPREDREVIINKRRGAFQMLEMLDGVLYPMSAVESGPILAFINGNLLSKDNVDVLRQSLMATKQYKVRDKAMSKLISSIVEAMVDRQEPEAKTA